MTDQNIPLHPQYPTAGTVHHCTHACIGGMHDACPRTDVDVITCNCVCHGRPTPHPASTSDARKRKAEKVNPIDPLDLAPSRRGNTEQADGEQALAALIKAHDFSRMECVDHGGKCCPEGGCHDVEEHQYDHLARILTFRTQALREAKALTDDGQANDTARGALTDVERERLCGHLFIRRPEGPAAREMKALLIADVERILAAREEQATAESAALRERVEALRDRIINRTSPSSRWIDSEEMADTLEAALAQPVADEVAANYPAGHGWTPGNGKFGPPACRVMLARRRCFWTQEQHDPDLPPFGVDAFGYRRKPATDEGAACSCGHSKADHHADVGECLERDRNLPCGCKTYEARP